jgi:hypothetical protein
MRSTCFGRAGAVLARVLLGAAVVGAGLAGVLVGASPAWAATSSPYFKLARSVYTLALTHGRSQQRESIMIDCAASENGTSLRIAARVQW